VPVALACGALVGLANGLGVAFLRIPSMVFTLGMNAVVQGIVVMYTGGNAPPDQATPILRWLAVRETLFVPNAVIVWAFVGVLIITALHRTPFGRYVYAIGNSERVAYLSGIGTRTILIVAFVTSGACSAFAGAMLAGYAGKAYQAMGDPYLLPAIAAVVLGGTSILGGRGNYPRHHRRGDPDHALGKHSLGNADLRLGATDHLRRYDRRYDAGLRPRSKN
jgi:ribose transport system permease protein